MNLPNKITLFRIILIPFFIFFFLSDLYPYFKYIALAIFIIASITDFIDGNIARKRKLVTNFGKFIDPLADKLLVCSALICFIDKGLINCIIVLVIISRDFIISGFRLVASDNGVVLAASMWGKVKTAVQMIMCILLIVHLDYEWYYIVEQVFIWSALVLTIVSLVDYLVKNRNVIKKN